MLNYQLGFAEHTLWLNNTKTQWHDTYALHFMLMALFLHANRTSPMKRVKTFNNMNFFYTLLRKETKYFDYETKIKSFYTIIVREYNFVSNS